MDNKALFREKNLKRVSSPEELNDYLKVTTPRVWIVLIAVILLLAGALIWGFTGSVEVKDKEGNSSYIHPITFVIN